MEESILRFVLKFGGSSLSSIEKIKKVAFFIKTIVSRPHTQLIIVVSAMGKTTDKLLRQASLVSSCPEPSAFNTLVTTGEIVSASLLTLALQDINVPSVCLTAKDIKIHTKGNLKNAIITHIDKENIENKLAEGKVVVVPGFQGVNEENKYTLLGRGGSDTTAVGLGIVFDAKVKIYTDVYGYYVCDPKIVPSSNRLKAINIKSALKAAPLGAKILDFRCLELANKYKKEVEVLESGKTKGTRVVYDALESYFIDNISFQNKLLLVKNHYSCNGKIQLKFKKECSTTKLYVEEKRDGYIYQTIVTSVTKDFIKQVYNHKKYKNMHFNECDMLILTGSGFIFHDEFMEKVQNLIKINKFSVLYMNLSESCLKIVVKKNFGARLCKLLAEEFQLTVR